MTNNPVELQDAIERVAVSDELDEALRAFHYEAFRAGVCYERDEWPHSDEEWADLDRSIQSEAVGEHYDGWADDCIAKLARAAIAVLSVSGDMREALIAARKIVASDAAACRAFAAPNEISEPEIALAKIDAALSPQQISILTPPRGRDD